MSVFASPIYDTGLHNFDYRLCQAETPKYGYGNIKGGGGSHLVDRPREVKKSKG